MKWAVASGFVMAVAAAAYLVWIWTFPTATVRYRLTFEVDANGKPFVGSGVIQVTRQDTTSIGALGGVGHKVKGEAVVVDLAERGVLFALLHGRKVGLAEDDSFPPYVILRAFAPLLDRRASVVKQMHELQRRQPKVELPNQLLPMLVRFRDINDPTSVEQVDPDKLDVAFGPGVRLRRTTIEVTRDAITTAIGRTLPWLGDIEKRGGALDGSRIRVSNNLKSNLGSLAFRRGGM